MYDDKVENLLLYIGLRFRTYRAANILSVQHQLVLRWLLNILPMTRLAPAPVCHSCFLASEDHWLFVPRVTVFARGRCWPQPWSFLYFAALKSTVDTSPVAYLFL